MPDKQEINAVRQVLFNELGLNREEVRAIVRESIKSTVLDAVDKFFRSGEFDKWLKTHVGEELRTWHGDDKKDNKFDNTIRASIERAIAKHAKESVEEKLIISFLVK